MRHVVLFASLLLFRVPGPASAQPLRSSPLSGVLWHPIVEMGEELFPSYILAIAGRSQVTNDERNGYYGDPEGLLGVRLNNPRAFSRVEVRVAATPLNEATVYSVVLPQASKWYEVFPQVRWNYGALRQHTRNTPLDLVFSLYVDGVHIGDVARGVRVRSINESPYYYVHRSGTPQNLHWMFAAYVDEDHPQVDVLLREALDAGIVDSFTGYLTGGGDPVIRQVFALWHVLQRRGFQYSSITTTSGYSDVVYSQHVRLVGDALATAQANCIDGTVLFASVLRKIGIDPYIIVAPGHAYLGFYLDAENQQSLHLETTMMGTLDLRPGAADWLSRLPAGQRREAAVQQSETSFANALAVGAEQFREHQAGISSNDPRYQYIDIAASRQYGIMPLGR